MSLIYHPLVSGHWLTRCMRSAQLLPAVSICCWTLQRCIDVRYYIYGRDVPCTRLSTASYRGGAGAIYGSIPGQAAGSRLGAALSPPSSHNPRLGTSGERGDREWHLVSLYALIPPLCLDTPQWRCSQHGTVCRVQAVVMRNAGHRDITQFLVWCRELL